MCLRFALCLILAAIFASQSVLAAEQQILLVKVDGFDDTQLLLSTDNQNRVQGLRIVVGNFQKKFSAEEFRKGYTKTFYGFKAVSVRSPDLDPLTGGVVDIEYRREASLFSSFDKFRARLARASSGEWTLQELGNGRDGKPFKVMNLSVRKEDKGDGTYKFLGIDGYKLSAITDLNAALVLLSGAARSDDPRQYGDPRHPKPSDQPMVVANAVSDSSGRVAAGAY